MLSRDRSAAAELQTLAAVDIIRTLIAIRACAGFWHVDDPFAKPYATRAEEA
jgi:hypothetical protein